MRWSRIRTQFQICLRSIHCRHGARAGRGWNERAECGLKLALGVDQKACGSNNLLPRFQPLQNDKIVSHARAQLHLARLDVTVTARYKSNLASARLQDSACRDNKLTPHRDLQTHVDEHAWFKLQFRVGKDNAHFGRPRVRIHLRVDEVHTTSECPARIGIHGERSGSADLYTFEIVLEYLGLNPNGGKVGDSVEAHSGLNCNAGESGPFSDVTGNRRIDFKLLLHLAG